MITNYLKVALRSLLRKKGYAAINITGLAFGMSVSMLIGMWVYDELTFNNTHDNHERIGRVYQHNTVNDEVVTTTAAPVPLGQELKSTYGSDFRHIVRGWWEGDHILAIDDQKILRNGTFMDGDVLEMLSLKMVTGSWHSLDDPSSIVLSTSAAKALFGDNDPVGNTVRIDNAIDVKVTGVYEDIPHNSAFHAINFIGTWEYWVSVNDWMREQETDWNANVNLYVELEPQSKLADVNERISHIKYDHLTRERAALEQPVLFIQPMGRWHLHSQWYNGEETGGRAQYVWLFGAIGCFVLLLACINFMNLSTAQSQNRAKEVGIRKSIGSVRLQLVYQFLAESFIVVALSFLLAIACVSSVLPLFNELAAKQISIPWANPYLWLIVSGVILATSLVAGSYPALYLSSFQPVKVLKGTFKAGRFAAVPRRVLVVFQFTVSIALIIGTMIVWQQIEYAKNRPVGYERSGLIMARKLSPEFWGKFETLKQELITTGAAQEVAESSSPATEVWFNSTGITWKGKNPEQFDDFVTMAVTHDFGKTMGWRFKDGRDFSREHATDSAGVILNESAANKMGLTDPVGEEIMWNEKRYTIIGVIEDMIIGSPYEPVKQTVFWLDYTTNTWINIRLNPALSTSEALARTEKVFQSLFPNTPFDYKFTDQEFAAKFSSEERIGRLAGAFASLSIFISCLGLFGMASFMAEQRRKEIGVRKILGASVADLWRMMSWEFMLLVAVACLIGVPIAVYCLHPWLEAFAYHTQVSATGVALACAGAFAITILTISVKLLRACSVNPVNSLRAE